jgi:hypothetical protein
MIQTVHLLEMRQQVLEEPLEKERARFPQGWTSDSTPPVVREAYQIQRTKFATTCKQAVPGGVPGSFHVDASTSAKKMLGIKRMWTVRPASMRDGDYLGACTCGGNASSSVFCKHTAGTIAATDVNWTTFLKPWLTVQAWETQVGKLWDPITGEELLQVMVELDEAGEMQIWCEPDLRVRSGGAPKKDKTPGDSDGRAKDFLEKLEAASEKAAMQEVLGERGGNAGRGGVGVKKTCILCTRAGAEPI